MKRAAAVVKKVTTPAAAKKPAFATEAVDRAGRIVCVEPNTRTLVVDVPHRKGVLTVGAWATDKTRIAARGKKSSFGSLKQGDRVRIAFHRIPTGDELTAVPVLPGSKV